MRERGESGKLPHQHLSPHHLPPQYPGALSWLQGMVPVDHCGSFQPIGKGTLVFLCISSESLGDV